MHAHVWLSLTKTFWHGGSEELLLNAHCITNCLVAVISSQRWHNLCKIWSFLLKVEVARSSKMLVSWRNITQYHSPVDLSLNDHLSEGSGFTRETSFSD